MIEDMQVRNLTPRTFWPTNEGPAKVFQALPGRFGGQRSPVALRQRAERSLADADHGHGSHIKIRITSLFCRPWRQRRMSTSRRTLIQAALAAAAAPPVPASAAATPSFFDPWVEIHSGHLRHNVAEIHKRAGSRPILAVIKNNGYGMGVVNAARLLEPLAALHALAVVKLDEAHKLRDAGIRKPILLMGPVDEHNLRDALSRRITPMVYTPVGALLERLAARGGRPVPVHICIDTGIGRVGVPYTQAAGLIRDLASRRTVRIQGTMMTFTEDPAFDREQLRRFQAVCGELGREGIEPGARHAASSYALFQHPDSFLDMVRPGMAVYGVYPESGFRTAGALDLRPVIALRARVAYVKQLRRGDSAGYNRAYIAKQDVWVATIPTGHADGLPRQAARGARVRIQGELYPLIATVSASHSIAEIGPQPRVAAGDPVTFFDWQEGSRPEDLARACGASVYDLLMHLNPLLARRLVSG